MPPNILWSTSTPALKTSSCSSWTHELRPFVVRPGKPIGKMVYERHGGAWKAIWNKLVTEMNILDDELAEAIACTSDAENQLRNKSGYSPRQWVFGTQLKMPGGMFDSDLGREEFHDITAGEKMGHSHTIRVPEPPSSSARQKMLWTEPCTTKPEWKTEAMSPESYSMCTAR